MEISGTPVCAAKAYFDGTHRTRCPEETFALYAPHMPAMGITRIADISGLDRIGLPVAMAVRPNSRSLSTSQGKGQSIAAARTSALMEAIESWHGERVQGEIRVASHAELAREVDLPPLMDFAIRADAELSPSHPLPWIRGWDLMAQCDAWMPLDTVSTNFVEGGRAPLFLRSTNGLASGNHLLEAAVHALNEVVERDALTLASLGVGPSVPIDPETIPDRYFQTLHGALREKGIAISVADLTGDLGIPTFSCTLAEDPETVHWRAVPQVHGHGTHLDYDVALSRALHEAIQSRATMISGSRDDLFPDDYRDTIAGTGAEYGAGASTAMPLATISKDAGKSFEADLDTLLARLRRIGIEHVLMADLTRKPFDVPVVKVVVPGLEPVRTAVYRPGHRARAMMQEAA